VCDTSFHGAGNEGKKGQGSKKADEDRSSRLESQSRKNTLNGKKRGSSKNKGQHGWRGLNRGSVANRTKVAKREGKKKNCGLQDPSREKGNVIRPITEKVGNDNTCQLNKTIFNGKKTEKSEDAKKGGGGLRVKDSGTGLGRERRTRIKEEKKDSAMPWIIDCLQGPCGRRTHRRQYTHKPRNCQYRKFFGGRKIGGV